MIGGLETIADEEAPSPDDPYVFDDSQSKKIAMRSSTATGVREKSGVQGNVSQTVRRDTAAGSARSGDSSVNRNNEIAVRVVPDEGLPVVPEAYLVVEEGSNNMLEAHAEHRPEENVIDAQPMRPWCRDVRVRLLMTLFVVVVVALAVALGVSLSTNEKNPVGVSPPSNSPSLYPTASPPLDEVTKEV